MIFRRGFLLVFLGLFLLSGSGLKAADTSDQGKSSAGDEDLAKALSSLDDAPASTAKPSDDVPLPSPASKITQSFGSKTDQISDDKKSVFDDIAPSSKPLSDVAQDFQQKNNQTDSSKNVSNPFDFEKTKGSKKKKGNSSGRLKQKDSYSLTEHLSESEVRIFNSTHEIEAGGVWSGDHFNFPEFQNLDVRLQDIETERGLVVKSAISIKVEPKHIYQIRFNEIPAFSELKLQYNLKGIKQGKIPDYMFFRILVGKYEVKRIQISTKDSWVKQSFDLGVISFLNHTVPITFEFATTQASGLLFFFKPEVT